MLRFRLENPFGIPFPDPKWVLQTFVWVIRKRWPPHEAGMICMRASRVQARHGVTKRWETPAVFPRPLTYCAGLRRAREAEQ